MDIMQEEQLVFNVVFRELTRQVGVNCQEQAEVLARLRQGYARQFARMLDVARHVDTTPADAAAVVTTQKHRDLESTVAQLTEGASLERLLVLMRLLPPVLLLMLLLLPPLVLLLLLLLPLA